MSTTTITAGARSSGDRPPRVLLALNHSPAAHEAARVAVRLLAPAGAEFVVLDVAEVPPTWTGGVHGGGLAVPLQMPDLTRELEASEAEVVAADAEAVGVPDPTIEVTSGDPVTAICRAAEEHDVDLIVVGAHDRGLLRRLLEPSVSRGVVRSASCPVLVVPEGTG